MKKNIAVSLLSISPESATGSFVYVKNLLDNLFLQDKHNSYFLIVTSANADYFKKRYKNLANVRFYLSDIRRDIFNNPVRLILRSIAKVAGSRILREKIVAAEIQNFIDANKIEIIFFPSGAIYPKAIRNAKIVTTILDLQHEYFPENFTEPYLNRRRGDSAYAARNSDHIISISNYTKSSIVKTYGIDSGKISVIYLAPQDGYGGKTDIELPDNFVFYPAAVWPHKNHKVAVRAMDLIKDKFPDLHLVFTGIIKNTKLKEELDALIEDYGLNGRIHFLGFVSDKIMAAIYKKAKALVFPSAFEGFGIPVVEAFRYGIPVIAADNSSISEIAASGGILVETGNAGALAEALARVLSDDNLKQDLIKKGHERAKDFDWEIAGRQTLDVFERLC